MVVSRIGKKSRTACVLACAIGIAVTASVCTAEADEFRGMWVDAWGQGFKTPEQTSQLVEFAAEHCFTALFIQVRKRGDAYYTSSLEPRAPELAKDYDPLADVIQKAHKRGLQVHPWVMLYDAWNESKWVKLEPTHVYAQHPDWITQDNKGAKEYVNGRMYLDPGLPEVRQYLTQVVLDIVRKYPVDGMHLDGLRYPDAKFGYNSQTVAKFNAERHGNAVPAVDDSAWCDWRREQVTNLARELPKAIRKIRPSVEVSLAAYWNRQEARNRFFQDWALWLKDGFFDFVVPMVFVPKDVKTFAETVDDVLGCGDGSNVYIGQGTWRFPPETTNRHLRVIRGKAAPGFVLFDYSALCAGEKGTRLADQLQLCPKDAGRKE